MITVENAKFVKAETNETTDDVTLYFKVPVEHKGSITNMVLLLAFRGRDPSPMSADTYVFLEDDFLKILYPAEVSLWDIDILMKTAGVRYEGGCLVWESLDDPK